MSETPRTRSLEAGYEKRDVSLRGIVWTIIGGIGGVATALALVWGLLQLYDAIGRPSAALAPTEIERARVEPPRPRLLADPADLRETVERRDAARLQTYGWVDEEQGIAHVPIDEAMRVLVEQGWPQPASGPRPPPAGAPDIDYWPDWRTVPVPALTGQTPP
ncbi:MAG: hypothetical protein KDE35_03845 [Geminicoccaceae bacterium]|nr:hypothetical protein [Geminicoccaceae bacterium]